MANLNVVPQRAIFTDGDLHAFLESSTKAELLKFILASGQSCATETFHEENLAAALSPGLACLVGALQGMKEWLHEIPPLTHVEMRFGNPAFKQWHRRMVERAPTIMARVLQLTKDYPPLPSDEDYDAELLQTCTEQGREAAQTTDKDETIADSTVTELCAHMYDAFGHPIRLDYGTGHESSFQIVLFVLFKAGVFGNPPTSPPTKRRLKAATIVVWTAYLAITRLIQKDYRLEPAGSHGVWGLDDYHCIVFYYGAQQLVPCHGSVPSDIYQPHRESPPDYYIYYSCIDFIQKLKSKAPFFETSPMLHDISSLPSWSKVASGLLKLYEGEVLSKLPVVQHWVFGPLFPATWTPSQSSYPPNAPTETFRTMDAVMPPTRAPWAK
jgi:Phosphotyrosyl phosphate activator (PTPA) protein